MYPPRVLWLVTLFALLSHPARAQDLDPGLQGNWTLDVAKSTFGVLALVFANGYVYADAVVTDSGCALIGVPADYSCTLVPLTPTHVRFTLKQATAVRRVGEITLVDRNTTRTVHRVTPASGPPYTETTVWTRDREE
jgi:hypothetical protein